MFISGNGTNNPPATISIKQNGFEDQHKLTASFRQQSQHSNGQVMSHVSHNNNNAAKNIVVTQNYILFCVGWCCLDSCSLTKTVNP